MASRGVGGGVGNIDGRIGRDDKQEKRIQGKRLDPGKKRLFDVPCLNKRRRGEGDENSVNPVSGGKSGSWVGEFENADLS